MFYELHCVRKEGVEVGLGMQKSEESLVNNACKELAVADRRAKPHPHPQQQQHPPPTQLLKCPRCESMNTKFCYFNNYNMSQPRHFCKNCRRYWTKGGSLRNVPVGGGCRKNKRSNKTKNGGGDRNNSTDKSAASKSASSSGKCGGGGGAGAGAATTSSSSSLVNNAQDGSDKSASIGFDSECNTTNNSAVSCSFSSGLPQQIFNADFHQVQLLNSGNSLSSISYENPQFTIDPAVISGSFNWSLADMQWKHQQSLTSLLTDGRTPFDGSAITEPPPLLEDITSLGEAALSRFTKSAPVLSWPSLLQDDSLSNTNLNTANNNTNDSNTHLHAFDWRANGHHHHNESSFLELQSDLGSWGGANWPDLGGSYAPGTSLP